MVHEFGHDLVGLRVTDLTDGIGGGGLDVGTVTSSSEERALVAPERKSSTTSFWVDGFIRPSKLLART